MTAPLRATTTGLDVGRSVAELDGIRAAWEEVRWQRLDPVREYYLAVIGNRPEVVRPHIVVLRGAGDERTVFVGRIEDVRLATSVGYGAVYQPAVRALTLVHGGVAGADNFESASILLGELWGTLARGDADVVLLPAQRTTSPLFAAVERLSPFLGREHGLARKSHWAVRLPESFDDYIASRSKKTRENLRVYRNRLFRDHDTVAVRVFRRPEEAETLFRAVDLVAAKTYQRSLGVGFAETPEQRALAELGLERGWTRVYVLYVRDKPIAFWPGSAYNGTFFVGTPGYDPAFGDYSVGTYLLMRVIEDLCSDAEIDVLDFGFGEADYKRRFGNESWDETDVILYAPTVRAIRINLTRAALSGGVRLARLGLERTGLARRLKRRWRRRLARTGSS